MELVLREYIVDDHTNFQETIKGTWIFERVDNTAIIWIVDHVLDMQGPYSNVTTDTSIKFRKPVYRFGWVEGHAQLRDITRTRCTLDVELWHKHRKYGPEPVLVATGVITFAFIDKITKKPVGLPREHIEQVKIACQG